MNKCGIFQKHREPEEVERKPEKEGVPQTAFLHRLITLPVWSKAKGQSEYRHCI